MARYKTYWIFATALAASLALWLATPPTAFLADDSVHILAASYLNEWPQLTDFFVQTPGYGWHYRPLLSLTYFAQLGLTGYDAGPLRGLNLAFHFLNMILVFLILQPNLKDERSRITAACVLAVFLFMHPIGWHSVLYISARSTLMVAFFILATIWCGGFDGWKKLWVLPMACFATFTKETGLLALPLAALVNHQELLALFKQRDRRFWLRFSFAATAVGLVIAWLLSFRFLAYSAVLDSSRTHSLPHNWINYFLSEIEALWIYAKLLVMPWRWGFYHWVELRSQGQYFELVAPAMALIAIAALIWWNRRFMPTPARWLLISGLITFIPELVHPRELLATEQRLYLPILLFSGALALVLMRNSRPVLKVTLTILAVVFGTIVYQRMNIYSGMRTVLKYEIEREPQNLEVRAYLSSLMVGEDMKPTLESVRMLSECYPKFMDKAEISRWYSDTARKIYLALLDGYLFLNMKPELDAIVAGCPVERFGALCDIGHIYQAIALRDFARARKILRQLDQSNPFVRLAEFEVLQRTNIPTAIELGEAILIENPDFWRLKRVVQELKSKPRIGP